MKHQRYGQAAILAPEQLEEMLSSSTPRYRLLWAICYYTSCRISEALQLTKADIIHDRIIFRSSTTKEKRTRDIKITTKLAAIMESVGLPDKGYLFPGSDGKHLSRQAADLQLKKTCDYLGFRGISTHSFRRTAITNLHHAGTPIKHIQGRSGHSSLANLAKYVEVDQEAVDQAGELL